jgi:hypothetical protein
MYAGKRLERPMNGERAAGGQVSAVVRDAAELTVGLTSLAGQAISAALQKDDRTPLPSAQIPRQRAAEDQGMLIDTAIGGAAVTVHAGMRAASATSRTLGTLTRPVTSRLLPDGFLAVPRVRALTEYGHRKRLAAEREARLVSRRLIGRLVVLVLDQLDLTHEVLDRVDLNAVVKSVDLDAAVGLVNLDAILDQVDLDRAVRRVDLDAIVDSVDLDRAVRRVDLDAIVDSVDLNRAVRRVDLDAIVDSVDLNRAVRRVDIDGVIATADINAVLDRLDLVGIAADIVAALDLPDIIRDSSGSLATSMVRDARVQSMAADEAVSRIVDRLLLRRRRSRAALPEEPAE